MFYVLFFRCKSSIDDLFPPNFLTSFLRITLHGTRTPRFYTRTVFHFNISKMEKLSFKVQYHAKTLRWLLSVAEVNAKSAKFLILIINSLRFLRTILCNLCGKKNSPLVFCIRFCKKVSKKNFKPNQQQPTPKSSIHYSLNMSSPTHFLFFYQRYKDCFDLPFLQ